MKAEKPVDRRVSKTKSAIREALISLIEEKGFDAILVSDITRRANINRGTLYLHYQDKYDLLEQTQKEIIRDIENIILKMNVFRNSDVYSVDNPLPVIVSLFEYLKENATLMHAMISFEGGHPFQNRIKEVVTKNLRLEFIDGLKERNFLVPSHYLIAYTLSADFGVIQEWLYRGCLESPHEMAVIISKISLFGVLRSTGYAPK